MLRTLVVLTLVAMPVAAQEAPHAGTWKVTYSAGAKMENGAVTPITGTGTLTLKVQGDSLIGTLVTDPLPDMPPRADIRMAGKRPEGVEATLVSESQGKVQTNGGEERPITAISTWQLKVKGDSLVGTVDRKVAGMILPTPGPQPIQGVRAS